jgi:hypothetical protein
MVSYDKRDGNVSRSSGSIPALSPTAQLDWTCKSLMLFGFGSCAIVPHWVGDDAADVCRGQLDRTVCARFQSAPRDSPCHSERSESVPVVCDIPSEARTLHRSTLNVIPSEARTPRLTLDVIPSEARNLHPSHRTAR